MKYLNFIRFIIIVIILLIIGNDISVAQENKRGFWFDLGPSYSIPIQDWNTNEDANKFLFERYRMTMSVNILLSSKWGLKGQMSILAGERSDYKIEKYGYPLYAYEKDNYEKISMSKRNLHDISFSLGGFYLFRHRRWDIMPYGGIGLFKIKPYGYDYYIKGKGNNNLYNISMYSESRYYYKPFIEVGLDANYYIVRSKGVGFYIGAGAYYQQYTNGINMKVKVSDGYDHSFIEEKIHKDQIPSFLHMNLRFGMYFELK